MSSRFCAISRQQLRKATCCTDTRHWEENVVTSTFPPRLGDSVSTGQLVKWSTGLLPVIQYLSYWIRPYFHLQPFRPWDIPAHFHLQEVFWFSPGPQHTFQFSFWFPKTPLSLFPQYTLFGTNVLKNIFVLSLSFAGYITTEGAIAKFCSDHGSISKIKEGSQN